MKRFFRFLIPTGRWKIPVIVLLGILTGFVFFLFHLSRIPSYLTNDPSACVNCHIMAPYYATWNHGSHREVATCNDCHVPHNNFINAYYFKAKDGLRHATIFSLRREPQVIFIREPGRRVVNDNCIKCHQKTISLICDELCGYDIKDNKERTCWECHSEIPHGSVNSLSSVPYARVPLPSSPVPDWLDKLLLNE
jgi:cytochrome c nitrite reductase small subunit